MTGTNAADGRSYYGRPVLKAPTWKALDIAGYLFLGGLAGASAVLGAGSDLTGRRQLARAARCTALGAISLSAAALVHDLGKPSRFVNMLRVFKPTSPMSVGSWLLAGFGPLAGVSALTDLTGIAPAAGRAAGMGSAVLGSAVSAYPAALIADTAGPAWHDARRHLPFVFVGSSAAAAGGLGMIAARTNEAAPARRAGWAGAAVELGVSTLMERQIGLAGQAYGTGRAGTMLKAAKVLTGVGGLTAALAARHNRVAAVLGGGALLAGSALTRFGIFHAGLASAEDPKYTVLPQRARLENPDGTG
jgi:formate-dependent nitrite reductase membrane component NrfD